MNDHTRRVITLHNLTNGRDMCNARRKEHCKETGARVMWAALHDIKQPLVESLERFAQKNPGAYHGWMYVEPDTPRVHAYRRTIRITNRLARMGQPIARRTVSKYLPMVLFGSLGPNEYRHAKRTNPSECRHCHAYDQWLNDHSLLKGFSWVSAACAELINYAALDASVDVPVSDGEASEVYVRWLDEPVQRVHSAKLTLIDGRYATGAFSYCEPSPIV